MGMKRFPKATAGDSFSLIFKLCLQWLSKAFMWLLAALGNPFVTELPVFEILYNQ
jgi:hypothetical protein